MGRVSVRMTTAMVPALVLALALACTLALSGCGDDAARDKADTETATEAAVETTDGAGDEAVAEEPVQEKAPAISAAKLYEAYEADTDAAAAKYDGKRILVSGEVWNVSIEDASKPYLTFKTGSMLASVRCSFADGQEARLTESMKGGQLTLSCICEGQVGGVQNVHLKECRF